MARVMKDSGVQWIGQIPKEWGVVPVKRKYKNAKEIVGAREPDFQRLALTMNGIVKRPKESADGLQPEKFDTYQIIYNQELLFKLIDLENVRTSRVGRSQYTGIVSPVYIRLINPQESSYGFYFFTNLWHQEVFNYLGSGVRSSLNATDLLKMPYLHVPEEEQRKIVEFLDEKTTHIESIIEKMQASITAFKRYKLALITETVTKGLNPDVPMKNSGIEWIGMIPEKWEGTKIRNLCYLQSGKNLTSEKIEPEGMFPVYGGNGIRGYYHEFNREGNHILIGRQGALCGNVNLVRGKFWATEHAIVVENKNFIEVSYFYYLLQAMNLNQYSQTAAQPGLAVGQINNLKTILPPIIEQRQIATFLDEKTAHIDRLIQNKESMIEKLEAYKKSLIYEYVTGKKEVE